MFKEPGDFNICAVMRFLFERETFQCLIKWLLSVLVLKCFMGLISFPGNYQQIEIFNFIRPIILYCKWIKIKQKSKAEITMYY